MLKRGMSKRRLSSLAAFLMACACLISACSSTIAGTATPAKTSGDSSDPRPPGRNADAVTSALRELDACALLDVDFAKQRGTKEVSKIARAPHACMFATSNDYSPEDTLLEATVGVVSDQFERYRGAVLTLQGAKAYEFRDYSASTNRCRIVVPVSFDRGIEFKYEESDVDTCKIINAYAEHAIGKLQNPDGLKMDPTQRPLSGWDGCSLLTAALGDKANRYKNYKPKGTYDPFSGCETRAGADLGPSLEVDFDTAPDKPVRPVQQINGKSVEILQSSSSCTASWAQGPSGNQNKWLSTMMFKVTSADCDLTTRLVTQLSTLAAQAPPAATTPPQRPLLFGPNDNDTGQLGACVDFGASNFEGCVPAKEVPIPASGKEIMAADSNDLTCAVYKEAVQSTFGASFTPVSWGQHCMFVDPSHTLELTTDVIPSFASQSYAGIFPDAKQGELAGKPAIISPLEIYLSPAGNLTSPGSLHIGATLEDGRGADVGAKNQTTSPKIDKDKVSQQLQQVMTSVVQKYFA